MNVHHPTAAPDPQPPTRVLVVDDSPSLRQLVCDYLTQAGMQVATAENGRVALELTGRETPDIILLDLMMPEMSGIDFLRAYRARRGTPIIVLSARLDETDKVLGLELGADDYVSKPFGMRELVARIRAVLRRTSLDRHRDDLLRAADISLNRAQREVRVAGRLVQLTPSEFELLASLMAAPGRVYSREILLDRLQGPSGTGVERTVDVHVRNLRAKIEPDPALPRYIETVFGIGYRFHANSDDPGA